jgi:hypothetical protein
MGVILLLIYSELKLKLDYFIIFCSQFHYLEMGKLNLLPKMTLFELNVFSWLVSLFGLAVLWFQPRD